MEFTKTTGWLDWYADPSTPRFQLPPGSVDAHCLAEPADAPLDFGSARC